MSIRIRQPHLKVYRMNNKEKDDIYLEEQVNSLCGMMRRMKSEIIIYLRVTFSQSVWDGRIVIENRAVTLFLSPHHSLFLAPTMFHPYPINSCIISHQICRKNFFRNIPLVIVNGTKLNKPLSQLSVTFSQHFLLSTSTSDSLHSLI